MSEIIDYYSKFDEWGRLDREPLEFKVNWHFIQSYLPSSGQILDNGAGPGKYAMALAKQGYQVTLTDLTPRLVDVAKEKAEELNLVNQFADFLVRDARDLADLKDGQFDAALMLGPLYHLQAETDRIQAVRELHRVTRTGGTVFVAVRPRIRKILTALMSPSQWKPLDNLSEIQAFQQTGIFNHANQGRFTGAYFFNIADIRPFFEQHGFETISLVSSTGIGGRLTQENWDYWAARGEEEQLMELIYESADDPYILGATGSHLLYIGRKK
ncbi:class I SAM-dependent methyltransferase [Paenibacillus rhizovicinus]|uniref:Class I SAM-dependent methyltransferase n=1 Tax=Paenibacillus rhizovicinus TaxID=2704463 RepID=A0A6C0PAV9_9BACL|nr:class I SAM-dependent methyltransferase [Paenibacillus rhizovicinus]QHW34793.1 class I SAM-dependent methyltransferase [Paenibacillus rhizovicinus]